jgi:hypothetical protein
MALAARHADRSPRSPFARGRGTNGNPPATQSPPPAAPTSEDHDPTSLPIFAGAWTSEDQLPGRTRSDFTLRPLVASPDDQPHAIAAIDYYDGADLGEVELDWELIAQYRAEVSSRLTARLDKEGGRVRALGRNGQDVIVDAGRLGLAGWPQPLVAASDLTLLVTRSRCPLWPVHARGPSRCATSSPPSVASRDSASFSASLLYVCHVQTSPSRGWCTLRAPLGVQANSGNE